MAEQTEDTNDGTASEGAPDTDVRGDGLADETAGQVQEAWECGVCCDEFRKHPGFVDGSDSYCIHCVLERFRRKYPVRGRI